jgi:hypothetical protein
MLRDNSNRICTYFAIDFEPHLGTKVADAAQEINERLNPEGVTARTPLLYAFRWPTERWSLTLDVRRIGWQGLGLAGWSENLDKHTDTIRAALETIGVETFKRIAFKVTAYLPMQMSHQELCSLMFGSFVASSEELEKVLGERADPLLHVEGERDAFKYTLLVSPMNPQQIVNSFRQNKNLEQFLTDKFLDTAVKDFQERISSADCLLFDIDLFQNDVSAERLGQFLRESLEQAERTADACVRCLRSQPIEEGK